MDKFTFRELTCHDVPQLLTIESQDVYSPWSESLIKDCLNREHYYNVVSANEEQVLGYIICNLPYDECHLMNLAVAPDYRHQGIGRKLLNHAIGRMRDSAEYMILEVREENTIARKLYESVGFEKIGLRRNYYQQGEGNRDALVYRLEL